MSAVYLLTLSQLSGRWRLLVMSVLALMPIVLTESLVLVPSGASVEGFELIVLNTMMGSVYERSREIGGRVLHVK